MKQYINMYMIKSNMKDVDLWHHYAQLGLISKDLLEIKAKLDLHRYADAMDMDGEEKKQDLKQALDGSSISTAIFIAINIFIILTGGYASVTALFSLEFYFMLLVPLFLLVGIMAFSKAVKGIDFNYPLIGHFINPPAAQEQGLLSE